MKEFMQKTHKHKTESFGLQKACQLQPPDYLTFQAEGNQHGPKKEAPVQAGPLSFSDRQGP
jgi:hypothetical protein